MREPPHAAVDVDHLAGDVARLRRRQERDQICHVLGLAEVADRDVGLDKGFPFLRRIALRALPPRRRKSCLTKKQEGDRPLTSLSP